MMSDLIKTSTQKLNKMPDNYPHKKQYLASVKALQNLTMKLGQSDALNISPEASSALRRNGRI
jgi:hypothetical protein